MLNSVDATPGGLGWGCSRTRAQPLREAALGPHLPSVVF